MKKLRMRLRAEVILPQTSESLRYRAILHLLTTRRYGKAILHFDPVAERRLRWKIDLYIVPTVSLLYLFCFIDRANIGKCVLDW